jgi:hypothetical protein
MDVWARIAARAQRMEADAAHAARRKKEADKRKKEEMDELFIIIVGLLVALGSIAAVIWALLEGMNQ